MSTDTGFATPTPDLFERVARALNAAYFEWTPGEDRIQPSPALARLFDLDPEDWTVQRMLDHIHPDDLADYKAALTGFMKSGGERIEIPYRYRRRDGAIAWCLGHYYAERDPSGRVTRLTTVTTDITKEKEHEAANRALIARQDASIEILSATTASPDDPTPVLDTIVQRTLELTGAEAVNLLEYDGAQLHQRAMTGWSADAEAALRDIYPMPAGPDTVPGRAVLTGEIVHLRDVQADPAIHAAGRALGHRSAFAVPLMREGRTIGVLFLARYDTGGFDEFAVALVRSFAEQAVIALSSAAALRALRDRTAELAERNDAFAERIAHQAATIDVLKEMSASPGDPRPVFDLIARRAQELCNGVIVPIAEFDGTLVHMRSVHFDGTEGLAETIETWRRTFPMAPTPASMVCRAIIDRKIINIRDMDEAEGVSAFVRALGAKGAVTVPLMRDGVAIGSIGLTSRTRGGLTDTQIELLQTFAEQAVIAITSAETFRALQTRTADLQEALEYQTATSDVLKVISRSTFDLQPVLDTVAQTAARLCAAEMVAIFRRDGDGYRLATANGFPSEYAAAWRELGAVPLDPASPGVGWQAIREHCPVHIPDAETVPGLLTGPIRHSKLRTALGVPLLREGEAIGSIVLGRQRVEPFAQGQIDLVSTFADQAVIAMDNARLLGELREALEQQTATAAVLGVINESRGELTPVFDAIVDKAMAICDCAIGALGLYDGEIFKHVVTRGFPAWFVEQTKDGISATQNASFRMMLGGARHVHIPDLIEGLPGLYPDGQIPEATRLLVRDTLVRSVLGVPLRKEGRVLGYIGVWRREVRPFSDKEIALLENFAAQAVIAMENARLLTETREALEQQTATAELLRVINANPGNLAPVFEALMEKAALLCDAPFSTFFLLDGTTMRAAAISGFSSEFAALIEAPRESSPATGIGRVARGEDVVHLHDVRLAPGYLAGDPLALATAAEGVRSWLGVPLRKEGVALGAFVLCRSEVRPFTDKEIALLKNFAEQAVIAIENARLLGELHKRTAELAERNDAFAERIEHQAATIDVLKEMSASPGDPRPVFDLIVQRARALCNSSGCRLMEFDGERVHLRSSDIEDSTGSAAFEALFPMAPARETVTGRAILERRMIHIRDLDADPDVLPVMRSMPRKSQLAVPLMRDGAAIGAIVIGSSEPGGYSDSQVALLETFAEQAVIAISSAETYRALQERTAALAQRNSEFGEQIEHQSATIDVLKVMSSTRDDTQPVFDLIVRRAQELCHGVASGMYEFDGELVHLRAWSGTLPGSLQAHARSFPMAPVPESMPCRAILERETIHVRDFDETPWLTPAVRAMGIKSAAALPIMRDGRAIGAITLGATERDGLSDSQIELLKTFAEQAAIAIGSAETYRSLQERTAELAERNDAFAERIEHQAATIDVLKEMSASPGDARPALETIARRARALCNANGAVVYSVDGPMMDLVVYHRPDLPEEEIREFRGRWPRRVGEGTTPGPAIIERRILHIRDMDAWPEASENARRLAKSAIWVPLMRGDTVIGLIGIDSLKTGGFSDTQVELLQTFAEQAVIAIGSAETYRALRERTAALAQRNSEFGERIEQQSATIDVLKVMSSTPDDTQPVFDQIVRRAAVLCDAAGAALTLFDGALIHLAAQTGLEVVHDRPDGPELYARQFPRPAGPDSTLGRAILSGRVAQNENLNQDPRYGMERPEKSISNLAVPLLRDGKPAGAIVIARLTTGEFTDSQIALLHTFAEQAVIAIGSVANFRALRERTAELTRSVAELQALEEVLRAVNSSLDLDTVLTTIIGRAVRLSQADEGMIYEFDESEKVFIPRSAFGMSGDRIAGLRQRRIKLGETYLGRSALEQKPVHVDDVQKDTTLGDTGGLLDGIYAVLAVPLLKDSKVVGGLVIRRRTEGGFPPATVTLMQTFAGQSVLAIENARLFQQLAERGEEARRARQTAETTLADLRRTQDRLVQTEKLASLGQLTAGIAHEIKNPLNFVNNFAELAVSLLDELLDALSPAKVDLPPDTRADIDDIVATLKLNLEKIVHHGKRADSIVKNMLLHSRTGTSEHRPVDLNATVEEALNLAYHGARAENKEFNITMKKILDPKAGSIEAYPQELNRVLLNLFGNGFYAAHKRHLATPGFDPVLTVTTEDLGDQVRIRVRDNGTGMPDDIRDKIFEPFFTTKPAGEGTGLGLSLSHDIVVKQHGGQLTVDSRLDSYTEFTILLPRQMAEGGTA